MATAPSDLVLLFRLGGRFWQRPELVEFQRSELRLWDGLVEAKLLAIRHALQQHADQIMCSIHR